MRARSCWNAVAVAAGVTLAACGGPVPAPGDPTTTSTTAAAPTTTAAAPSTAPPVTVEPASASAAATTMAPAEQARFLDTFDTAVDADPGYGLNDSLAQRQPRSGGGVTYTRVPGVWYPSDPPRPWFSQVNHPSWPGRLAFFRGHSAVRVDAPAQVADSRVAVTATLTPTAGNPASADWASIVLSRARDGRGYVTDADVVAGVLVRANGEAQVFRAGRQLWSGRLVGPTGDGTYQVGVALDGSSLTLTMGGVSRAIDLGAAPPAQPWVYLGRYSDNPDTVTTVDDLTVSRLADAALRLPAGSRLRRFGFFPARITVADGNHLPEVRGRSNLNWVQISDRDRDRYRPEVLDDCGPGACVVSTGHEFFQGCAPGGACALYPDAQARWQRLADAVRPHLDRVAAFYLLDEPYWRGASFADLQRSAQIIKATFPGTPVMLVEAAPRVAGLRVPPEVDWVGFDQYCAPIGDVEANLARVEAAVADRPAVELFLFAQGAALGMCNGVPGQNTDARIAATQWEVFRLAASHPKVTGIFTFGLWVSGDGLIYQTPSQLPRTTDAQERIAARILASR